MHNGRYDLLGDHPEWQGDTVVRKSIYIHAVILHCPRVDVHDRTVVNHAGMVPPSYKPPYDPSQKSNLKSNDGSRMTSKKSQNTGRNRFSNHIREAAAIGPFQASPSTKIPPS